jgi:hypothetical protein
MFWSMFWACFAAIIAARIAKIGLLLLIGLIAAVRDAREE